MTKKQELLRLERLAEELKEGYCGRWLSEQLPFIKMAMESDLHPGANAKTMEEWRRDRDMIIEDAERKAKSIVERACREAEGIKAAALEQRMQHKKALVRACHQIVSALEDTP